MSVFYGYGIGVDVLACSPVGNVRRPKVPDDSSTVGLSADELSDLLGAADDYSLRMSTLVNLLGYNGVRIDQALSADEAETPTSATIGCCGSCAWAGKTAAEPLAPRTVRALDAYLAAGHPPSGPPFLDRSGTKRLAYTTAYAQLQRLVKKAGITAGSAITPHSLRHTFVGIPGRRCSVTGRPRRRRPPRSAPRAGMTGPAQNLDRHPTYALTAHPFGVVCELSRPCIPCIATDRARRRCSGPRRHRRGTPVPYLLRRAVAVVVLALLALTVGMASASAHVTVNSPGATQGGYAVITFRVPSESAAATTTAVTIQAPAETPLASARIKPIPGWTHTTTMQTLDKPVTIAGREIIQAIATITWTADDGIGLRSDEFQEFQISTGPLPETDTIVFKAVQTYSDGTRVDWIEQPVPGSTTEPEHPAPTLALAPATAGGSDDGDAAPTASVDAGASTGDDSGSATLGIVAMVVAIAALLGAGASLALTTRRRQG